MKFLSFLVFILWLLVPVDLMAQNYQDSKEGDLAALKAFYNATGGDNWTHSWDIDSMTASNMGTFYGVTTNAEGRVTAIAMNGNEEYNGNGRDGGNNLVGTLPVEIGNLTKVTYFNVKHNQLSGDVPWHAINNMASLKYLLLNGNTGRMTVSGTHHPGKTDTSDSNSFVGTVNHSLLNLKQLEWFELSAGQAGPFTGDIPDDFLGNSSEMLGLFLHHNKFTSMPSSIGNMEKITNLNLSGNLINGKFPFSFKKLTSLRNIRFSAGSGSGMDGTLPDIPGGNLRLVIFSRHNFTGGIPQTWVDGSNPLINTIIVGSNNLSGPLPEIAPEFDENGNRNHNIGVFNVNGNNFTGEIPASYATNFRTGVNIIGLGWNDLEGEMPQDWSAYKSLRYLRVSSNKLTGSIPTKLPNTRHLYFDDNNFTSFDAQSLIDQWEKHNRLEQVYINQNSIPGSDIEPAIGPMKDADVDFKYEDQDAESGGGSNDDGNDDGNNDDYFEPETPEQITPHENATDVVNSISFEWSNVDADEYILQVTRKNDQGEFEEFFYSDKENISIGNTSYTVDKESIPGTIHAWRVRAVKDGFESEWSPFWEFTTRKESIAPGSPYKIAPSHNDKNVISRPTFKWESVEGAESYSVQVVESSSNTTVIDEQTEDVNYTTEQDLKTNTNYEWRVRAHFDGQEGEWSDIWEFKTEEAPENVFETELNQNYPNPFNPTTNIQFRVSETQDVSLKVYDMAGRLVATLFDGSAQGGALQNVPFNAESLASGIYFYRFITESEIITRKMTLMK